MDRAYLPFIEQTLHYFNRPHEHAAVQPVAGGATCCACGCHCETSGRFGHSDRPPVDTGTTCH